MAEQKQASPTTGLGTVSASEEGVTKATDAATSATGPPAVVDKGQGERQPAPAPGGPPTPGAQAVTVSDDVDFEALMSGGRAFEGPSFEPGDKVKGVVEVISLHGNEVFLDLGGRATGYVLKEELRDAEGSLTVAQGDELEGVVAGVDSSGVHVRMKLGADADSQALRDAFSSGVPVEGKVMGTNKGGYDVMVAGQRAFCPFSQIDVYRLEDEESVVGQTMTFKITEMRGGSIVVSRAAVLRAEQAERAASTLATLAVGARMTGRVRSIKGFGAFVDLGGVDGLVHIRELSWDRVDDPHEVVKLGQEVEVVVVELSPDRKRINLSMRQAQGDPFEAAVAGLKPGDDVTGTVVRLAQFGAFVNIAPGTDGLIHVSDLAHARVRHPKEVLQVGDTVRVRVIEVDLGRRRVGLSLKALTADPWDAVGERYPVGSTVTGKVESIQAFGVFVALEGGVTALLPASESNTQGQPLETSFRVGAEVEAKVLRVDVEDKKMALTRRDDADRRGGRGDRRGGPGRGPRGGGRDDWGRGRGGGGGRRRGGLAYSDTEDKKKDDRGKEVGSFGALLLAAMKDKGE